MKKLTKNQQWTFELAKELILNCEINRNFHFVGEHNKCIVCDSHIVFCIYLQDMDKYVRRAYDKSFFQLTEKLENTLVSAIYKMTDKSLCEDCFYLYRLLPAKKYEFALKRKFHRLVGK